MLSNKKIVCPKNLINVAKKSGVIAAAIVNAGEIFPMESAHKAVQHNLINPLFIGNETEIKKHAEKLKCNILDKSDVIVYDEYIGSGYGEPTKGMIEATKLLAEKEAILLDPVYSGKCFAGLIGLIKNKKFTKNDNVLFIHTGGAVSLSAYEWAF